MSGKHLRQLAEYCDGRLTAAEAERATAHLAECARCRAVVDDFRFAAGLVRQLTIAAPPDSVWRSIDNLAWARPSAPALRVDVAFRSTHFSALRLAAAALIAVIAFGASYWFVTRQTQERWPVARLDGVITVDALSVGEALETDAASRLRLTVGTIGTVDVQPNTRVRLVSARSADQRLSLEHGEITATISAPPRLFFVNTSSSTVVDLGCKYTMRINEGGFGSLRVELGWASLEWGGHESLVPAGASCTTRPQVGPGTPSFDDASETLRDALRRFDFENGGQQALDVVLAESRVRDTLTLWHLLSRVDEADRARVFDRIVALTPLPSGVTREKALQLDKGTLERWRQELAWTW